MYNQTEHQQLTGMAPSPASARGTFTVFGARHIKGVAITRWIVAVCLVTAGVVLLAFGHWWGAVFFVPAAINGSLAYLVPRWNRRPDTPSNAALSA